MEKKQDIDIKAALENLDNRLETFGDHDAYKAYLREQAKFHKYSPSNVAWLWAQKPDATYIAGYNAWLKMGRKVRKGETSLRVLAPLPYTKIDADGNEKKGVWFKTSPVFDVSQTDPIEGHPNPFDPNKTPAWLPEGDTDAFDDLVLAVSANGARVDVVPSLGRAGGVYYPAEQRIEIPKTYSTVAMCTALIHEWAHHMVHDTKKFSYAQEEVIVESVAYVVSQAFGIISDDELSSLIYIKGWMKDDRKSFKAALTLMQKTAHTMILAIEHSLTS